jgi:phosphatidylserine decarboxylase
MTKHGPPRRELPSTFILPARPSGDIPETLKIPRHGKWLPGDVGLIQKWVHQMIEHVAAHPKPFLPIVVDFRNLIESDPAIYMLFHTMFNEDRQNT